MFDQIRKKQESNSKVVATEPPRHPVTIMYYSSTISDTVFELQQRWSTIALQVGIKMFRATIVGSNRLQTATGFPKLSPDRILTMNNSLGFGSRVCFFDIVPLLLFLLLTLCLTKSHRTSLTLNVGVACQSCIAKFV